MVLHIINGGNTGDEGNSIIGDGSNLAYNDPRRILERSFGTYPVVYMQNRYSNRFLGSLNAQMRALFGNGITTLDDAQALMQKFFNLIDGITNMSPDFEEYLTTEGYRIVDPDVDGEGSTLNERHMLYWLDYELKRRKSYVGYTNRLSEAGWGEEAPDSLTEADPLDLVNALENRGWDVVVIDYDADEAGSNNLNAASETGCVRIDRTSGTAGVKCIDNSTPKSNATLLNGNDYRYKFWKELGDWHERGGTARRCPNIYSAKVMTFIRATSSAHSVYTENIIGVRVERQTVQISGSPTGGTYTLISSDFGTTAALPYNATAEQVQAALRALPDLGNVLVTTTAGSSPNVTHEIQFHRITQVANPATLSAGNNLTGGTPVISHATLQTGDAQVSTLMWYGYPGELPEIWCGNSTDNDATPTESPNPGDTVSNGTSAIFLNGSSTTKYRDNFHIRNIKFHGKRQTVTDDFVYCGGGVFRFAVGNNCSMRHCIGVDLQPIPNGDSNEGLFPDIVDSVNTIREQLPSTLDFGFVTVYSEDFVFDSNYCEGVYDSDTGLPVYYPNANNSAIATITTSDNNGGKVRFNFTGAHGLTTGKFRVSGHIGFTGNTKLAEFDIGSVTSTTITTTADWTGTGGTGGTIRVAPNKDLISGAIFLADNSAANVRVTRNRFMGFKAGTCVSVWSSDGAVIEDNIMEGYDGSSILIADCTNFSIQRNLIGPHGAADYAVSEASHGIQCGYSSDGVIYDNIIYAIEPTNNNASFSIWHKGSDVALLGNIDVRRNLCYRGGMYFDSDKAGSTFALITWALNIIAGMPELHKNKLASGYEYLDAPLLARLDYVPGDVPGTLDDILVIDSNYLWRFEDVTPDQDVVEAGSMLAIRNFVSGEQSDFYNVDDILDGWTNNVVQKPLWVADPEAHDFRLTNNPVDFSAGTPFNIGLSRAWMPQEVV